MPAKRKQPATEESPPVTISLTPDQPFACPGIRDDNPRDFLAALGLLRLLHTSYPAHGVSLSWHSDGHPIYTATTTLPESALEELVADLQRLNAETPHPFVHHKVIKVPLAGFRKAIERSTSHFHPLPELIYAAYGSQVHDSEKNETTPTAFSFSNGQGGKELLRDISELIQNEFTATQLLTDLSGKSSARKDAKSFRWHPAEYRAAAYRAADPGGNVKGDVFPDHPSLNILAFFGLTFFPVVDRTRHPSTAGFSRQKHGRTSSEFFTWPIWSPPLDLDTLSCLLLHPALHAAVIEPAILRSLGCTGAWSARRFSADKSLYFSPAAQIF